MNEIFGDVLTYNLEFFVNHAIQCLFTAKAIETVSTPDFTV